MKILSKKKDFLWDQEASLLLKNAFLCPEVRPDENYVPC